MSAAEKIHGGHILYAVARHFDWFRNRMMTEFLVDGGQADLVFITRSNYLWEIEIKISRADWNADQHKRKWEKPRPHVARFFYAVPAVLAENVPEWVPPYAGVLAISKSDRGGVFVKEVRSAKRLKAQPVTEGHLKALFENTYYRFWRRQMSHMRERFIREAA